MRITGSSRDRLLAAASVEFSDRGFEGAKVDRIARRARVNKAMLYYHFDDKAALYREILRDLFETVAIRLAEAAAPRGRTPGERLQTFIRTIAAETAARPLYPSIWLREMAEGGRHVDASIIKAIGDIVSLLASILQDGQRAGEFRPVHPIVVQMGIIAPLLLFAASAPSRERFGVLIPGAAAVPRDMLVSYLETAAIAALRPVPAPAATGRTRTRTAASRRTNGSRKTSNARRTP